jgi:hypothetical protein
MSISLKATVLSLGLLAGTAFAASAQTSDNLSALPPGAGAPSGAPSAVAPSAGYPGPAIGGNNSIPNPPSQAAAAPSPGSLPGPAAGAGTGVMPPHFEKPPGYDQNPANSPYTSGLGPRAN